MPKKQPKTKPLPTLKPKRTSEILLALPELEQMKITDALLLLFVIVIGATVANLIALKIAADQVSSSVGTSPLVTLLGALGKK